MTRDEILNRVQNNNQPNDEFERDTSRKGLLYGLIAGVLVCIVMIIFELIKNGKIEFGKPVILLSIAGVSSIYEGKKSSGKKLLLAGIVEMIFAFVCLILYVGAMFI